MRVVFCGSSANYVPWGSCGCACYQNPGGIAANKPSVQA